jgi:hypothetical protein
MGTFWIHAKSPGINLRKLLDSPSSGPMTGYPSVTVSKQHRTWRQIAPDENNVGCSPIPRINVLQKIHACKDGFQIDRVLLVPECVMSQEVDVLPSDGRYPHAEHSTENLIQSVQREGVGHRDYADHHGTRVAENSSDQSFKRGRLRSFLQTIPLDPQVAAALEGLEKARG